MDPAIEVEALSKVYPGGVEAVSGIDFAVAPGEVFGLLGPNGAGKSTTVGMLTSTVAPTSGAAWVGGHHVAENPLAARRVSSVVFQEPVVDLSLTGRRNVEIHARLWGAEPGATDEVAAALGLVQLLDRPVATYSGGQKRRLELARALVSRPHVLFLDEPTVGLDPRIRAELLEVIQALRERSDMTVLLTTHYLEEAERLCDRVAIIHGGRIVALDKPQALLGALGNELLDIRLDGTVTTALSDLRRLESPATMRSRSAPASPSLSTTRVPPRRSRRCTTSDSAPGSAFAAPRSTTSTCASPATLSPRRLNGRSTDVLNRTRTHDARRSSLQSDRKDAARARRSPVDPDHVRPRDCARAQDRTPHELCV
jgi:ABC-2 type transport system ATP-binding protein